MRIDMPENIVEVCLGELLNAEHQLILALPRVAARARQPELRTLVREHLAETRIHAARLLELASELHLTIGGRTSIGMAGLLREGEEVLGMGGDPRLVDQCIAVASRKIEHYEMVSYESAISLLAEIGQSELGSSLEMTLDEERQADQRLLDVLRSLGAAPVMGAGSESESNRM